MLTGYYAYPFPETITAGIDGIRLLPLPENPAALSPQTREATAVLLVRQGLVTRPLLSLFPNLKWLQLLNSGYELVDLNLLRERGLVFTNARSVFCRTIAEDVMAKLLLLARRYPQLMKNQAERRWEEPANNLDLYGKTLAIIGAGSIGQEVAKRAAAFEMRVIGYDLSPAPRPHMEQVYAGEEGLTAALAQADFVVLCIPTLPETRAMANATFFARMKPTAYLINVARGDVIDQNALTAALDNGKIAGTAIDVCTPEPLPPSSPLWDIPGLFITPHQAAYGDLLQARMCEMVQCNLQRYLRGEPLMNIVDVSSGQRPVGR